MPFGAHSASTRAKKPSSSFFQGFIRSLLGFLLGLRNEFQEHHEKSISPVVFSEHHPIHFADLTTCVDLFRGQGGEVLEAAILQFRRNESSSSRMSCKGDLLFMHALETLGDRGDLDFILITTDGRTGPEPAIKLQLRQKKCQDDNKDFTKGNRGKQGSGYFCEPSRTCILLATTNSKIAQKERLCFFHGRNALFGHAPAQKLQQIIIRQVNVRH